MTSALEEERGQGTLTGPWYHGGGWLTPLAAALQFLTVAPPLVRRPFTPAP